MTPAEWLRAYEREKEKEFTEMFNSNGEPKSMYNVKSMILLFVMLINFIPCSDHKT